MYSIHLVYFKRCNTFHLLAKLEINFKEEKNENKWQTNFLESHSQQIVHPRKEERQNRFHFREFHQILNLLRGGEKRQLSKRSMFIKRVICYTPS